MRRIISGWLFGKMIILSFRVCTSKNGNIDRAKDTCTIVLTQVTMKPTLPVYSVIQKYQVHIVFVFYVFRCSLKEKDYVKRNSNSKDKVFICEIIIIIILIYRKLDSVQQKT